MNIIETTRLTRRFGATEAVHELTLAVPAGSVFALLGPNGAGKTTTLKLLMNLIEPTTGSARVLGIDSRKLGERELAQIGYVSESQQLPLWMTVRQLLDYCRPFYPTWDRALEARLLAQFALPEKRKLAQLSRGMLMKAALLSSLAYRPRLLVLDEPFSGLDPVVRDEFIRGVLEVSALGEWTVLVSSHDIDEVERLADHVAMLDAGRLRLSERTEELQARFRRVEVSVDAGNTWSDATVQEPVRPKAHVRFTQMWKWNGTDATIMSRATDDTGYVQPTRAELVHVRGPGTLYHYNPIYGWRVMPNGRVFFHGAP